MSIVSAIVLYAVIWFMVLFCILPVRLKTQGDVGEIEPGTHAGAPANLNMGRKARITSLIAAVIWLLIAGVIFSGAVSVSDLDWFDRMGPRGGETGG